ncbi:MAG: hypothetical protein U0168_26615 [Nannocystaceae bacterium]
MVDGRIARIEVEATELEIVAQPDASWPSWTVEGPRTLTWTKPADADFEVRPLELPGKPGEPRLLGELLLPPPRDAPLPAVLMLSATGQEDRYGFAGPPPVDLGSHELGDALAQAGFAVLRFDDRGRGESEPGPRGFLAQVDDARRALGTLLVQPEIDPIAWSCSATAKVACGRWCWRASAPPTCAVLDPYARPALRAGPARALSGAARIEQLPPDVREQVRQRQRTMIDDLVSGRAVPRPPRRGPVVARGLRGRSTGLVARLRVPVLVA